MRWEMKNEVVVGCDKCQVGMAGAEQGCLGATAEIAQGLIKVLILNTANLDLIPGTCRNDP